jgi:hypothetical protein
VLKVTITTSNDRLLIGVDGCGLPVNLRLMRILRVPPRGATTKMEGGKNQIIEMFWRQISVNVLAPYKVSKRHSIATCATYAPAVHSDGDVVVRLPRLR